MKKNWNHFLNNKPLFLNLNRKYSFNKFKQTNNVTYNKNMFKINNSNLNTNSIKLINKKFSFNTKNNAIKEQYTKGNTCSPLSMDKNNMNRNIFEQAIYNSDKIKYLNIYGITVNKYKINNILQQNKFYISNGEDLYKEENIQTSNFISKSKLNKLKFGYNMLLLKHDLINTLDLFKKNINKKSLKLITKNINININKNIKGYLKQINDNKNNKKKIIINIGSQFTTISYKKFIYEQRHFFQVRKIYNENSGKKNHIYNFIKNLCKYSISPNEMGNSIENNKELNILKIVNTNINENIKDYVEKNIGINRDIKKKNTNTNENEKTDYITDNLLQIYLKRLNLRLKKIQKIHENNQNKNENKKKKEELNLNKKKNKKNFLIYEQQNIKLKNILLFSKQNIQTWGNSKLFILDNLSNGENIIEDKNEINKKINNIDINNIDKLKIKVLTKTKVGNNNNKNTILGNILKKNNRNNLKKNKNKNPIDILVKKLENKKKRISTENKELNNLDEDVNQNQINLYQYLHNNYYKNFPYYQIIKKELNNFEIDFDVELYKKNTKKINENLNIITLKYNNQESSIFSTLLPSIFLNYKNILEIKNINKENRKKVKIHNELFKENIYKIILKKKNNNIEWNNIDIQSDKNNEKIKNLLNELKNNNNEMKFNLNDLMEINIENIEENENGDYKNNIKKKNLIDLIKKQQDNLLENKKLKKKEIKIPINILISNINRLVKKKSIEFIINTNHLYASIFYLKYYWIYFYNHLYPNKKLLEYPLEIKKLNSNKNNIENIEEYNNKEYEYFENLLINKQLDLWQNNISKKILSSNIYINYFKLRYYSKITNITKKMENKTPFMKKDKNKLELNLNKQKDIKKSKIIKTGASGYTKKLIHSYLYNKKIQQLNLKLDNLVTNKITNTEKNKNIIINIESNKLIKLQTDITLYNSLNLMNLTF